MNRRGFLVTSLGTGGGSAAADKRPPRRRRRARPRFPSKLPASPLHTCDSRLCVKPVMANVIHKHPGRALAVDIGDGRGREGKCGAEFRPLVATVEDGKPGRSEDVRLLERSMLRSAKTGC